MSNKPIRYKGVTYKSIAEFADSHDKPRATVSQRLKRGLTPAQSIGDEPAPQKTTGHQVEIDGVTYSSRNKACEALGIDPRLVHSRLKSGYSLNQAFGIEDIDYQTKPKQVHIGGLRFGSYVEACRYFNIDKYVFNARINRYGWTVEQALELDSRPGHEKGIIGIVYLVTHKETGKPYVGITMGTLDQRWQQHIDKAYSGKRLDKNSLHYAIELEGEDKFRVESVDKASNQAQLSELEIEYVRKFNSVQPNGFNLNRGGGGVRTSGRAIEVEGVHYSSITEACKVYGVDRRQVTKRIQDGWTPEEAVGLSPRENYLGPKAIKVSGVDYPSIQQAAKSFGLNPQTVSHRLRKGWTVEEAFEIEDRDNPNEVIFRGQVFGTLTELRKFYGVSRAAFSLRRYKGYSMEQCLGLEPLPQRNELTYKGVVYPSRADLARAYGVKPQTLHQRLKCGMTLDQALSRNH